MQSERLTFEPSKQAVSESEYEGPPLQMIDKWDTFKDSMVNVESDFSFFVASNLRTLSYDSVIAPYAHLSDGYMDLLYSKKLSRASMAKLLLGFEDGKHIDVPGIEYHKVKAFVLEPKQKTGHIMLDGEEIEVTTIKVEVHRGLGRVFKID